MCTHKNDSSVNGILSLLILEKYLESQNNKFCSLKEKKKNIQLIHCHYELLMASVKQNSEGN